jgi:hypothetical protein
MDEIYSTLLGCKSKDFKDLETLTYTDEDNVQVDPTKAYSDTYRQVVTLDQYIDFMGLKKTSLVREEETGAQIPLLLQGDFVEHRKDQTPIDDLMAAWEKAHPDSEDVAGMRYATDNKVTGIRWKLLAIANREFNNKVYA